MSVIIKFFRIIVAETHKLIADYPTLFREKFYFYYVFESTFGSMFYRKVSVSKATRKSTRARKS